MSNLVFELRRAATRQARSFAGSLLDCFGVKCDAILAEICCRAMMSKDSVVLWVDVR